MEPITYSEVNGYRIPNLALPDDGLGEEVSIGIWCQCRFNFARKRRLKFVGICRREMRAIGVKEPVQRGC